MPDGEVGTQEMRVPFTEQEILCLVQQRFSSTGEQVGRLSHVLRWLHDQASVLLLNCCLQYQTDSQAAKCRVAGMKGASEWLEAVAEIYRLCAVMDTGMKVVWQLRTEDWQRHTDALSKHEDNSYWRLNHRFRDLLLAQPELGGRRHNFDLFADEHSTQVLGFFTLVTVS